MTGLSSTLSRRKHRELLATLRVLIHNASPISIRVLGSELRAIPVALEEPSVRGNELRTLRVEVNRPIAAVDVEAEVRLPWRWGLAVVRGRANSLEADLTFSFLVENASTLERRATPRERHESRCVLTASVVSSGNERLVEVTWIDQSESHHTFLHAAPPPDHGSMLRVLDDLRPEPQWRGFMVEAARAGASGILSVGRVESASQVGQPLGIAITEPRRMSLRPVHDPSSAIEVRIVAATHHGFLGESTPLRKVSGCQPLLVEESSLGLRFCVRAASEGIQGDLVKRTFGDQVAWVGWLTTSREDVRQTRDEIVASFERLMLEGASVDMTAIANRRRRASYYAGSGLGATGPLRTRHVLAGYDEQGLVGYASFVRISAHTWAAIDNIGSARFDGRWNRDRVAPWLRLLADLLEGREDGVLWTFRPTDGIWNAFDASLTPDDLVVRHDCLAKLVSNLPASVPPTLDEVPIETISFRKDDEKLARALEMGASSEYRADTLHDYAYNPTRSWWRVTLPSGSRVVLTTTDLPDWVSLNGMHDPVTVFREDGDVEAGDEATLVNGAWHASLSMRRRLRFIVVVGQERGLGTSWIRRVQLLLRPHALRLAAASADQT